jgi:2-polyprenyl-3-methyl-5-hydroxy-6-metoxy-1,4-benzoquinol methylase
MDIASTYDTAAPTWTAKLQALGYIAAYTDFLERIRANEAHFPYPSQPAQRKGNARPPGGHPTAVLGDLWCGIPPRSSAGNVAECPPEGAVGHCPAPCGLDSGQKEKKASPTVPHHPTPTGPVLDAGCGTGAFATSWLAAGGSTDLTLLDASAAMLTRATARLAALGTKATAIQTTLDRFAPAQPFQTILAAHVIEHCPDPGATFHHLAAWLQPGGRLILVISRPHWCNWLIWLRFHHRWFSATQVVQMARSAGLTHSLTHQFPSGPPSRTSLGYIFTKP